MQEFMLSRPVSKLISCKIWPSLQPWKQCKIAQKLDNSKLSQDESMYGPSKIIVSDFYIPILLRKSVTFVEKLLLLTYELHYFPALSEKCECWQIYLLCDPLCVFESISRWQSLIARESNSEDGNKITPRIG